MTVPKAIAADGLLSTAEVADQLGVHRSTVWLWIKRGMLNSVKRGAFHGVKPAALARFRQMYDVDALKKPKRRRKRRKKART